MIKALIQWSAVRVTPSGIGKSVTVTDCHSNSSFLRALKWPIFEQNPSTFDWYMTQNAKSTFYLALLEWRCSNQPWNNASISLWWHKTFILPHFISFYPIFTPILPYVVCKQRGFVSNESGIAKTVTVANCHCNCCHSNRRPLYLQITVTPISEISSERVGENDLDGI